MSFDRPPFLMRLVGFARSGDACVETSKDIEATLDLVEELFGENQRLSAQNQRQRETIAAVGRCRDIAQANTDKRDAEQRQLIANLKTEMQELQIGRKNLDNILLRMLELKKT